MLRLYDRLLIAAFLKAYFFCLVSLLSLYIVVDLFGNIDDFAQANAGLAQTFRHVATYYGYRSWQIFDRLCELIALLAAMFTVAWMQRNNELLPLLSAGISTRRIVRPVLIGACLLLGLGVANQELVIPRIASSLLSERDDPAGDKGIMVQGAYEPNGIHIEGWLAYRKTKLVQNFCCTIPENVAGCLMHLCAREARYVPAGDGPHSGGWLMTETQPAELEWSNAGVLEMIDPGKFFLHTEQIDFESVTRGKLWYIYASTDKLLELLSKPDAPRLAPIAVLFHMRLTRPILGLLLVFVGLSVILRDQNRNIFISAGLCLVMCAVFYTACLFCKYLGENEYFSPTLAAWMPVLFFGPLAFVLFDAVHT